MPAEVLEATPEKQKDGTVEWTLCHHKGGGNKACGDQPTSYPPVAVNSANQQFIITITGDQTGLGIKYAPEPIWAAWNTKPTGGVIAQIQNVNGAGTQKLRFHDTNTEAGLIKYQLNFVDKNGNKVAPLDPDIRNGGGNVPAPPPPPPGYGLVDSNTSLAIALLIALALGFAIGALVFRRRAR